MAKKFYDVTSGVPGVRLATKADEPEIYALLLLLHEEIGLFSVNHAKVLAGIRWATEGKGGVIFVIEERGRVAASLGMVIAQDWYSDDEYLQERWNFVHPEYRSTDYARKLLEQAKWSTEWFRKNTKLSMPFACGINSFDRTEAKIRLYARHMPCLGAFFIYGRAPAYNTTVDNARAQMLNGKIDRAMRAIDDANRDARRQAKRGEEQRVVPVVETILRVSRERDHV